MVSTFAMATRQQNLGVVAVRGSDGYDPYAECLSLGPTTCYRDKSHVGPLSNRQAYHCC